MTIKEIKGEFRKGIESSEKAKKKMTHEEVFLQASRNSQQRPQNSSKLISATPVKTAST
jgi:hypothetical protein